jgi:hypothetical protein
VKSEGAADEAELTEVHTKIGFKYWKRKKFQRILLHTVGGSYIMFFIISGANLAQTLI